MNDYEVRRANRIKQNQALLAELDIKPVIPVKRSPRVSKPAAAKKPKPVRDTAPTRTSARIAHAVSKPVYTDDDDNADFQSSSRSRKAPKSRSALSANGSSTDAPSSLPGISSPDPTLDLATLQKSWRAWTPAAPAPTRDEVTKQFVFASHPAFRPNKSPEEMLREGVFGGGYFRPLRSRKLGNSVASGAPPIADDWTELPTAWLDGLDVETQLRREVYEPAANKFGVACGQSIEEWEANGWIRHEFDVRGWFQWYVRFFLGRRCDDDDRQVGRWERCVGPRGRWRRMLLKAYVRAGVRTVWDDGEEEDPAEVSPVMHQTCLHWAWEVRQDELDEVWERGGV